MADYIDRQYAIEHYQHVCRRTNCKECPLHIQVTDTLTDCELELFLHNLPSADVQPIRHGEWVKKWHTGFHMELSCCSVCGHYAAVLWDYCPSCGARMDGE